MKQQIETELKLGEASTMRLVMFFGVMKFLELTNVFQFEVYCGKSLLFQSCVEILDFCFSSAFFLLVRKTNWLPKASLHVRKK